MDKPKNVACDNCEHRIQGERNYCAKLRVPAYNWCFCKLYKERKGIKGTMMNEDKATTYDNIPSPYSQGIAIGEDIVRDFHKKTDKALADAFDHVANTAFRLGWDEAKKSVPSWISVEDAMPEKHVDVLVFAKGKTDGWEPVIAISHRYIFKYFPSSEGEEMWSDPWRHFYTDYEVTHWMPFPPFPEIPTEEEEEAENDT